mgnify:CR=1
MAYKINLNLIFKYQREPIKLQKNGMVTSRTWMYWIVVQKYGAIPDILEKRVTVLK